MFYMLLYVVDKLLYVFIGLGNVFIASLYIFICFYTFLQGTLGTIAKILSYGRYRAAKTTRKSTFILYTLLDTEFVVHNEPSCWPMPSPWPLSVISHADISHLEDENHDI